MSENAGRNVLTLTGAIADIQKNNKAVKIFTLKNGLISKIMEVLITLLLQS